MLVDKAKKMIESYVNLYIPKKEKFENETADDNSYNLIVTIISWLVLGFAIYLSFRCKKGFDIGHFLLAVFCAPCYIIYQLATSSLCGLIKN
jgi:hypothetical protein